IQTRRSTRRSPSQPVTIRLMRRALKFISLVSTLALILAAVGVVTWATDTCTLYVGGHNANLTLQGWGSESTCQAAEHSGANKALRVVSVLTLGGVNETLREGSPSGDVICSGWDGRVRYTIRDQGFTGLNFFG